MAATFTHCLVIITFVLGILNVAQAQNTLPLPDHIVIIIEENQPKQFVIGSSAAPYLNGLIADSDAATFTQMFALEHPSQPDYLDLFAGGNQGVLDDNLPLGYPFTTPNMARQLLDKGLSFVTYSQNLPSVGSDVETANGYVRKHNPVANWIGSGVNQVPAACNQTLEAFPTDFNLLPTVSYVVPVEDSDMHNGLPPACVASADYWMKEHLDSFIRWSKTHNSLLIYTFDEDDGLFNNNIPTIFFGEMVKGGQYSDNLNLYNILRTLEDIYGTTYAGEAENSLPITNCWKAVANVNGINKIDKAPDLKMSPNPVSNVLRFLGSDAIGPDTHISITDVTGRLVSENSFSDSKNPEVNTSSYPAGLYFYQYLQGSHVLQTGKFIVAR